jgi:hypothetical protein
MVAIESKSRGVAFFHICLTLPLIGFPENTRPFSTTSASSRQLG